MRFSFRTRILKIFRCFSYISYFEQTNQQTYSISLITNPKSQDLATHLAISMYQINFKRKVRINPEAI